MARSTSSPVAAPGPAVDAVRGRSLALNVLISLRPAEWTKNLFVFAGLLFGLKLFDPNAIVDAVAYVALHLAYSFSLKHIVIIDVLTIAVGFVLRAVAGAEAVHVEISNWLLVCTILIALFIGLAKRRHEIVLLAGGATSHRPI